jgi:succinyl-diaminopimelate desuccinylase
MDVGRICSDLVRIKSENPPGDTAEVITYLSDLLETCGIRGRITRNRDGHWNLFTDNPAHSLLMCGHLDVVPALRDDWTRDPFGGDEEEGYIWGRGATDMKGGVACILAAIARIVEAGEDPGINLALVCDEETGGEFGIRYLIAKNLLTPCECIIAEPTPPFHPLNGQKGLCQLTVHFKGEPGHGSLYPHVGTNAIMEAYSLLEYLMDLNSREFQPEGEMKEVIETSSHVLEDIYGIEGINKVLRKITFNPGRIEGGEKANIIAQQCTLELDMRIPWGCDPHRLVADLAARAPRARIEPVNMAAPSFTPRSAPVVTVTCEEIERFYGSLASPIVQWAASDARYLRKAGFNVVEYGPGEIQTLHGIDERVSRRNLENVTEIYTGIIRRFTKIDPVHSR